MPHHANDSLALSESRQEQDLPKQPLDVAKLLREAARFSQSESSHAEPSLFGVTDGKAVGTYLEHKFRDYLEAKYSFERGSSANGIDFPEICVDMKVTSTRQPQSSCPFKSARQKIFGLGYHLLVFVYDKTDDPATRSANLDILNAVFIESSRTGDYQTTTGIIKILENDGNKEDLVAFMHDRNLPIDEIEADIVAEELLLKHPMVGYLTISNALQWRLQYGRVIGVAGTVDGIVRVR